MSKYKTRSFSSLIIRKICIIAVSFSIVLILVLCYSFYKYVNNTTVKINRQVINYKIEHLQFKINEFEKFYLINKKEIDNLIIHDDFATIPNYCITTNPFLSFCSFDRVIETNDSCLFRYAKNITDDSTTLQSIGFRSIDSSYTDKNKLIAAFDAPNQWHQKNVNDTSTLSFSTPIYQKNSLVGILTQNYNTKQFIRQMFMDTSLRKIIVLFTDERGNPLYTNSSDSLFIDQFLSGNTKHIPYAQNNKLYSNTLKFDNKLFLYIISPIGFLNWKIVTIFPYRTIYFHNYKYILYGITSVILCILAIFLITILIVYHIHKPFQDWVVKTNQLVKGTYTPSPPPQHASTEIITIHRTLNVMHNKLNKYVHTMQQRALEQEKINYEYQCAQCVQKLLLTDKNYENPNLKIASIVKQSRKVGGDCYDYFINDNNLYFFIGDVAGKGLSAAIYMSSIMRLARFIAQHSSNTAEISFLLNKELNKDEENELYITMFLGILNLSNGKLRYTNAGHPSPYLCNSEGDIYTLDTTPDVPLGLLADYEFSEYIAQLDDKELLFLYTDGITDAENTASEFYGKERLKSLLNQYKNADPNNIIKLVIKDIKRHINGREQSDDLTLVVLKYFKAYPPS